ncbi:MAG: hypothetical protein FWB90_02345 [Fibromonadales bacterium]|nr:hypothetical protein [Fibromonadales bacterium]
MEKIVKILIDRFYTSNIKPFPFVEDIEANNLLNDIENNPHAFVLACLMDRQIQAEKAWLIPKKIFVILQTFNINELANIKREEYINIFNKHKLHRFNTDMADIFYLGIQDIKNKYNGNASEIWFRNLRGNMCEKLSSSLVVSRFLEFKGCGIKIATMSANILATKFKIEFSDYFSIDISPDVHIKRVLPRMGLVPQNPTLKMVIHKARELYPEFPGIIDFPCWEIGRNWCKANNPDCSNCIVESECLYKKQENNS